MLNPSPIYALAAYFTQATIDHLGTIDNISSVRNVVVTEGMFKSTRVGKRSRADEEIRSDVRVGSRTYAAFPSPYQQQVRPGTPPNSNPVLMHEPYQRSDQPDYFRDQVEPSASYSQRTPSLSPISPSGQYYGDMPSYSGPSRSVRSNSYVDHPNPNGNSPYSPQYQPTTTRAGTSLQNYSNPILSPPWANDDPYYYTRPIQSGTASSPSAPPMSYNHSNTPQHASPSYTKSYTPSYSLESALTPPPSIPDRRGVEHISLQIPHYTSATQCHTPPDSAIAMEDPSDEDQSGLAPLEELKRSRYRREPLDEKTLRLLISGQSSP